MEGSRISLNKSDQWHQHQLNWRPTMNTNDSEMVTLADGNKIRREHLRHVYETVGVRFDGDGKAILTLGDGSAMKSIELDEDMLLQPNREDWKTFTTELNNSIGEQVELFDLSDKSHEFSFEGNRYKNLGRVYHHSEIIRGRLVKYYTYLTVEAPASTSDHEWTAVLVYVACVIATIGLLTLLTLMPGGQVLVVNFIYIVAALTAGCTALAIAIATSTKNEAYLNQFVGR